MYSKLFEKILDSSIWLESAATRVVWITLLAAKNQDQIALFAAPGNLARRSGVSLEECEEALRVLEGPDPHRPDQEFEGRRIERVESGWFILNGAKYDAIKSLEHYREQTNIRVRRHREKKKLEALLKRSETEGNAEKHPRDIAVAVTGVETQSIVEPSSVSTPPLDPKKAKEAEKRAEMDWRIEQVWRAHLVQRRHFFAEETGRETSNEPTLTAEIRKSILEGLKEHDSTFLGPDDRDEWKKRSSVRAAGIGLFLSAWHNGSDPRNDYRAGGTRYLEPWRPWKRQRGKPDPIPTFAALYFEEKGDAL